jgi:hypothetical protein
MHTLPQDFLMKRILISILCLGLLGVAAPALAQKKPGNKPTPTATPQSKAAEVSKAGLDEFVKGNHDAALKLFLEAANLDPATPDYLFNAGLCHSKIAEKNANLKNNAKAIEDYQAAIDLFQALLVKIPASNTALKERVEKSLVDASQKQAQLKFGNDQDRDYVPDSEDLCPTEAGTIVSKGCPDKDGDSIADKDDACATEVGPAATKGCPDKDGDLVADKDDACPDVSGVAAEKGCGTKGKGPEKGGPDQAPSEKKTHKIMFAGAGVFGAAALGAGGFGLLQIKSGNDSIEAQDPTGIGAKFNRATTLGYAADGLAVAAIACGVTGLVLRPKKAPEKTATILLSPTSLGFSTSF